MKALNGVIEFGAIAVIGLLALAFYEQSVAARAASAQSAADAQLSLNAGNALIGAILPTQQNGWTWGF